MKLADILLLGFSIALLIIGADQTIAYGFKQSYWAFMLALIPFFLFTYRRSQNPPSNANEKKSSPGKSPKKGN